MINELPTQNLLTPQIADYDVLRCIGSGAFGDVWLARAKATQRYRAIKLVCRSRFPRERPYEIEFAGLKKFEEVSLEHSGFVDILHVSRNDEAGYFSYVMELADDLEAGQFFEPERYVPKTLASELARRQREGGGSVGRFTPAECVQISLNITAALSALHQTGLAHRDIKPSNIVFARGSAKLADVGLVTELKPEGVEHTLIGSPPYMDEQVHGTAQGDLFAFGKVLYVMATGRSPRQWPEVSTEADQLQDEDTFRELLHISRKACDPDRSKRYKSADEIHSELLLLRVGHSLRRLQRLEAIVGNLKRFALIAAIMAVLAGLILYQAIERRKQTAELRQRKVGSCVANGIRAMDENDLLGALPWFAEGLRQDQDNPRTGPTHRLRLAMLFEHCPTIVQMWFTDHPVNYAQFAGQENQVLLPTADRRWAIHDLGTGRMLYPPFGQPGCVATVAVSTGTGLAATSTCTESNHAVKVWNFVSGQEVATLPLDTAPGWPALSLSPDGHWLAVSSQTNVIVWRLQPNERVCTLIAHSSSIMSIAFSPDSRRLATSSADASAIVWDLESGRALARFTNHTQWLYFASFSPDGRRVATASFDRTVRVWESETGRELLPPLQHGDGVRSAEFSPDGNQLVTAGFDFLVRVWDAHTGKLLHQLRHNSKPVYAAFSPSGRLIVTACYDGTERVWALPPRELGPHLAPLVYSGDGAWFATQTNQSIEITAATGLQKLGSIPAAGLLLWQMVLNENGSRLLTVASTSAGDPKQAEAVLWDSRTGKRLGRPLPVADPTNPTNKVVLSRAGGKLVCVQAERTIIWDFLRDREILKLELLANRAAFDTSGERLAVAYGNRLQIWNLVTGQSLFQAPLSQHTTVDSVQWSPDGRHVLTACWDTSFDAESAQVWDAATGQPAGPPLDHYDGVRWATFSPDGKRVLTCSEDFTAMIWDWRTGGQLTPPLQHSDQVVEGVFSPNGRWVATACRQGTVRVWDAETGEPITSVFQHPHEVVWLQWVNGGQGLLTKTRNGETRYWNMAPDSRPLPKLVETAELLSAQQIQATESAMPQTKQALQKLWQQLHSDFPAEFSR